LTNKRFVPHNHPNKTPDAVAKNILHLRKEYHLGPLRIVWYLERYHGLKISDAGVYRILKSNGVNRLPGGTRLRKIHTKRYNKQVPVARSGLASSRERGGIKSRWTLSFDIHR
jgi:hypothetical protein